MRERLTALPKPEWWDSAVLQVPPEHRPVWPEHLSEVDGFIVCWDKPYAQAYAYACRPKPSGAATPPHTGQAGSGPTRTVRLSPARPS